ncbi:MULTISPECIES: hypothetical protein [unclassified Amycolatopsis]|uniref:hypothetical protein n=1 Tax=unclassified Amycolatopsis TaxID=2618356 RepID=UPI00287543B1|nr:MULTISPECIES: hypothetical protein [unclassified Amycolatopsis]MDS0139478.1 hypothetical protein [Amycolatopsis sp. 505]MDS0147057.1 hypothetical protein [Amycolatopsis sp. CM201R]
MQRGFVRVEREPPAAGDDPVGEEDGEGQVRDQGFQAGKAAGLSEQVDQGQGGDNGIGVRAGPDAMKLREPLRGWGPVPVRIQRAGERPVPDRATVPGPAAHQRQGPDLSVPPGQRVPEQITLRPIAGPRMHEPDHRAEPQGPGRADASVPREIAPDETSSKWCPPSSYASRCPGSSARHSTDAITCRDIPCSPRSSRRPRRPPPLPRTGTPRSQAPRA